MAGAALVFAANNAPGANQTIVEATRRQGVPENAIDKPELSDLIMPAIIDRAPVTVSSSSPGTASVLARIMRRQIVEILPSLLRALARFAARLRGAVGKIIMESTQGRQYCSDRHGQTPRQSRC